MSYRLLYCMFNISNDDNVFLVTGTHKVFSKIIVTETREVDRASYPDGNSLCFMHMCSYFHNSTI
jgi:hypothetical protein